MNNTVNGDTKQNAHMLACPSCGAQFEMGKLKCPFCGNTDLYGAEKHFMDGMYDMSDDLSALADEEAVRAKDVSLQHAENMDAFTEVYDDAKKGLQKRVRTHSGLAFRWILVALLGIIFAVLLFVYINRFTIYESYKAWDNRRHYAERVAMIDSLIEEGDFCALSSYCAFHRITGRRDAFDAYRTVIAQSDAYLRLSDAMLSQIFSNGTDATFRAEHLAKQIHTLYENGDPDKGLNAYKNELIDPEISRIGYEKMDQDVRAMLKHYIGLSDDDCDRIPSMTESQIRKLVFDRLGIVE